MYTGPSPLTESEQIRDLPLLTHTCTHHTKPHPPHTHTPHVHIISTHSIQCIRDPRENIHHLPDILFCVKLYANVAQLDRRNPGDPHRRPEDPQMMRSRTGEIQETHVPGPRICHNPHLHVFSLDHLWDSPCSCSLTQSSCL
jgi:hypothetical protein